MNAIRRELHRIVSEFTAGIIGRKHCRGFCYMVSWPLSAYLNLIGFDNHMVEGHIGKEHHWWIELNEDGCIVDATAGQFRRPDGRRMRRVYIGPKPKWYRAKHP